MSRENFARLVVGSLAAFAWLCWWLFGKYTNAYHAGYLAALRTLTCAGGT